VMFWMPILCEPEMDNMCPLGFPGWTVAVGLPKIWRSLRPKNTTFSEQVPLTAIELGPAAGSDARAAVMLVNIPGVPPGQPTVTLVARAAVGNKARHKIPTTSLGPVAKTFMDSSPYLSEVAFESRNRCKGDRPSSRHVPEKQPDLRTTL
jgi:hypothetical protein